MQLDGKVTTQKEANDTLLAHKRSEMQADGEIWSQPSWYISAGRRDWTATMPALGSVALETMKTLVVAYDGFAEL